MKTPLDKLLKVFGEDELDRFCGIGLLTVDGQLIIEEKNKDLPLVNAGKTVYVLDPFTNGVLCSGDFDDKYVGSTNVYKLLLSWNYPDINLDDFTDECITETGEMLMDGFLIIDPMDGEKFAYAYNGSRELCLPDLEVIEGNEEDTFFCDDDRSVRKLIEDGRLMVAKVRDVYPIKYHLKLSFDANAKYDKSYETISVLAINYFELQKA